VTTASLAGGTDCAFDNTDSEFTFCNTDVTCPSESNETSNLKVAASFLQDRLSVTVLEGMAFKHVLDNFDLTSFSSTSTDFDMTYLRTGDSLSLSTDLEGELLSNTESFTLSSEYPTSLNAIIRTETIFSDVPMLVVKVWGTYSSQRIAGTPVTLTLKNDNAEESYTCSSELKTYDGITCFVSVSANFFGTTSIEGTVVVSSSLASVTTVELPINFSPVISYGSTSAPMFIQYPSFTAVEGATVETQLFGNATMSTGAMYELSVWNADISFSGAYEFTNIESDLYDITYELTQGDDTSDSILSLVGTYKSSASDDISGSRLVIANIYFTIAADVMDYVNDGAISLPSLFIGSMVSTAGNRVIQNMDGLIATSSNFAKEGYLTIESPSVAGLQVFIDGDAYVTEIVNTNLLGTPTGTISMTAFQIASCHIDGTSSCAESSASNDAGDVVTCVSSETSIIQCEGITVYFEGTESGSGDVELTVTLDSLTRIVPVKVWIPSNVEILVNDAILNKVEGGCDTYAYQSTTVLVTGNLIGNDDETTETLDLTSYATIKSDNATAVIVNDRMVSVYSPGNTNLVISAGTANVEIAVSEESVSVSNLEMFLLNELSMSSSISDTANIDSVGLVTLRPQLAQELSAEGDSASFFGVAFYSDGNLQLVLDNYIVTTSSDPSVATIDYVNGRSSATVSIGAGSYDGSELFLSKWVTCDTVLAEATPFVNISLPEVVDLDISLSEETIVHINDALAAQPLNWATESTITVTAIFADGSERDFSTDNRTMFSCTSCNLIFTDNVVSVHDAELGNSFTESFTVSLGSYSSVSKLVTIQLDTLSDITVTTAAYPSCSLSGCSTKTTASRLQVDDGEYQRLKVSVNAETAQGTSQSLRWNSDTLSIELSSTDVLNVESLALQVDNPSLVDSLSNVILIPQMQGTASVTVAWQGFQSSSEISVVDTPVKVSAIVNKDTSTDTASAQGGGEQGIYVRVEFDDDTSFDVKTAARSSVGPTWIDDLFFLNVMSSDDNIIAITADSNLEVLQNTDGTTQVIIDIASSLDSTINLNVPLFANLEPGAYDIDLGATSGAPFGVPDDESNTFDIAVRMNTNGEPLTAFELIIYFDDTILEAVSASAGVDWPYSLTSVIGDPNNEVGLIGSEIESQVTGSAVEIAVITFRWKAGQSSLLSYMSGVVIATTTTNNVVIGDSGREFVAGNGYLGAVSVARRLHTVMTLPVAARKLQDAVSDCSDGTLPPGDTNGDCEFNVLDLNTIKMHFLNQQITFVYQDAQLLEMDPNWDGEIDTLDINFLLSALAKTYRFLMENTHPTEVLISDCNVMFAATFADKFNALLTDNASTTVDLEIASTSSLLETSNIDDITTEGHIIIRMTGPDEGRFSASFTLPVMEEQTLQFVMLVKVYNQNGETDQRRMLPWRASTYGDFGISYTSFEP
jgi:hypothetical protein